MKSILIAIIPVLLISCVIELVNGNEYEELKQEYKLKIKKLEDFNNLDENYIYEITGVQLKQELKKYDKNLVYIFTHDCGSVNCIPLNNVINYANENNYNLYLVMTSYYKLDKTLAQDLNYQLFSINNKYYKEDKSSKYTKLFKTDLGYYKYSRGEKYVGNYMFFEKDSLINVKFNLYE